MTLPAAPYLEELDPMVYERVTIPTDEVEDTLSTALVTIGSIVTNDSSLNFDLYPTIHSALMAPFTLFSSLFNDVIKFYDQRSIFEVLSFSTLRSAVMSAPNQLVRYWFRLIEMEMECIFRTICDLSAFLSPRMPYVLNQILGIYFTTHSATNTYFRAVANGMINHNCVNYYPKCTPMLFFNRLANNVTDIISTTMSPITKQLMNALNNS
jgi:hypothetical protein